MKVVLALAVAALWLGFTAEVRAEKEGIEVTKSIAGLSIQAEKLSDGALAFTVLRDPTASPYHGRFYGRSADLKVSGPQGLVAKCAVESSTGTNGVKYYFVLAADYIERSELVLAEIDTTNIDGSENKELLGGGVYYHIRLKDFVPQAEGKGDR